MNLNLNKSMGIVGVFVTLIVVLALAAAFLPSLFASTASVGENITEGSVGNEQADNILHVFGFIVPIALVLGVIGLILAVAHVRKS